jgi:hypothetical protein
MSTLSDARSATRRAAVDDQPEVIRPRVMPANIGHCFAASTAARDPPRSEGFALRRVGDDLAAWVDDSAVAGVPNVDSSL